MAAINVPPGLLDALDVLAERKAKGRKRADAADRILDWIMLVGIQRQNAEARALAAEQRLRATEEVLTEGWSDPCPEHCIPLALAVVRGNATTTTGGATT